MARAIGIVDEANEGGKDDKLGIETHTKSLIRFIEDTNTPITVGVQGEWGSGKTSLINKIYHHFDQPEYKHVKQIWINSWEYSLLSTPEETLLKIVNRIIQDLILVDGNVKRGEQIRDGAKKIFNGALRVGASAAWGAKAGDVVDELIGDDTKSISDLRKHLEDLISNIDKRESNPVKRIIIYVDDLDRIEPRNAVALLELLKNIFSVPKCVFILAIDYQVVVKGLEHKFGKQTPENEWEFRAFFDKIIQLPFMMPMGQYNIGKYVNSLLLEIGFVEGEGLDAEAIREIILRTIDGNPRSIKRLVNSVSLIQIFAEEKKKIETNETAEASLTEHDEKMLLFALLCLQIAYPAIYSLLVEAPDFPKWDDSFAFKQTNRLEERMGDNERLRPEEMKKIFDDEFKAAQESDDFDDEWEKALYRICYGRPRLKPRASDISKFFTYIKDDLMEGDEPPIGETIARIMTETSVTSVTSTDQGQAHYSAQSKNNDEETVSILRDFRNSYLESIKNAGSKVYGSRSGGKSFSWYMRFKAKKNSFSEPKFLPRWQIGFFGNLEIRVDGTDSDKHIDLMKFFENNLVSLRKKLGSEYGEWRLDYKDDKIGKRVMFVAIEGLILPAGVLENLKFEDRGPYFAKHPEYREKAIEWSCYCIPIYEKLIVQYCEKFISENPGSLESPTGYGG